MVELAGFFDGPVALIAVRDEGSGILAGERDLIFDRFYRMADHDRTPGTGLGLPIARELARAMGGDLDVASVPGSGSSFILALPGPTSVDRDVLEVALVRAIATEEIRLEERAVLRAIRASEWEPRPVPTPLTGRRPDPCRCSCRTTTGRRRPMTMPATKRRAQAWARGVPAPVSSASTRSTAARPARTRPRRPDGAIARSNAVESGPGFPPRCGRSGDSWISPLTLR